MWLGEQITEKGIGNGISMILFAGILSRMPTLIQTLYQGVYNALHPLDPAALEALGEEAAKQLQEGRFEMPIWGLILVLAGALAMILFVVYIQNAERRIRRASHHLCPVHRLPARHYCGVYGEDNGDSGLLGWVPDHL